MLPTKDAQPFENTLASIFKLEETERFTDHDPDSPFRIDHLTQGTETWTADLTRLRMNEDLTKGTKRGSRTKLEINFDEGLCEGTAFLYYPRTRTLAFHENKHGGSINQVARVFSSFAKAEPLVLRPIMKQETLERIKRIRPYYLEIALAGVDNGRPLRNRGVASEHIFGLLNFWKAPKAMIRVEIPKPRGKSAERSTLEHVVDTIQGLLGTGQTNDPEVQRIVVQGTDPQTDQQAQSVINLLNDRLVEVIEVDLKGKQKATDADRHRTVKEAFALHRSYLEKYYSKM